MMTRLMENIVFHLSMPAHTGRPKGDLSHRPATFSVDKYDEWRRENLKDQFETYFDWKLIERKRVLDFGCGAGALSLLCVQNGAKNVIGSDLSTQNIARTRRLLPAPEGNVSFQVEERADHISLPDNSIDVILCFDVMEHIMEYESIIHEWARVLSPGGCVLLWWSVWWHPYGHHLQTLIPLPWVHVLMSDESLLRVCARIYDTPQFLPRMWHFDEQGKRKENPYRGRVGFDDLNKLTIRRFDEIVSKAGLHYRRKQINPFTGSRFSRLKNLLVRLPWPDFFCSCVVAEIEKPNPKLT